MQPALSHTGWIFDVNEYLPLRPSDYSQQFSSPFHMQQSLERMRISMAHRVSTLPFKPLTCEHKTGQQHHVSRAI